MIKKIKRWRALTCAAMMISAVICPGRAMAEESQRGVTIPVTVEVAGEGADASETFQVTLTGTGAGTPTPERSVLQVRGGGSASFGPIEYETPGDYGYTVSQTAGTTEGMTYDAASYEVTVRVVNGENGTPRAEVWAVKAGSTEKEAALVFHNEYVKATEAPTEPATEPETEAPTEPATEPETEALTEPETEAVTEPESESEEESETETEMETETERQTDPAAKADSTAPKTGDDTPIALWAGLMAAALAVIVALAVSKKRASK